MSQDSAAAWSFVAPRLLLDIGKSRSFQFQFDHHSLYLHEPSPNSTEALEIMAPKRNAAAAPKISQTTAERPITPVPQATVATAKSKKNNQSLNAGEVLSSIWQKYVDETPQRTKLIDAFMAFLVVAGVLQFVYCVIVGNYVCGGRMA